MIGQFHGLDRILVLAELALSIDLRQSHRRMRRPLTHGPGQQRYHLALPILLLHQQEAVVQLVGEFHLRKRIAVIGGEPPVTLGDFRLRIGKAVSLLHNLRHSHLRIAVAGLGGTAVPKAAQVAGRCLRWSFYTPAQPVHRTQRPGLRGALQPFDGGGVRSALHPPVRGRSISARPYSTMAETRPLPAARANHSAAWPVVTQHADAVAVMDSKVIMAQQWLAARRAGTDRAPAQPRHRPSRRAPRGRSRR